MSDDMPYNLPDAIRWALRQSGEPMTPETIGAVLGVRDGRPGYPFEDVIAVLRRGCRDGWLSESTDGEGRELVALTEHSDEFHSAGGPS